MNRLKDFLRDSTSRLVIVSACSAKKQLGDLKKGLLPTEKQLDDPILRNETEMRLASYKHPAAEMYTGDGHHFVRTAVKILREHRYNVSHFILSAGYGLLNETDVIVPYDVTFRGKSKDWIRGRAQVLNLHGRFTSIATSADNMILVLGREYLEAIGLPLPDDSLPLVLAYIAPSIGKRLGNGIATIPIGKAERKEIQAHSISVKEKWFMVDVLRFFDQGVHL